MSTVCGQLVLPPWHLNPQVGYVSIALPWPPSVNTYWRHVVIQGRVRVLLSEKGRSYRHEVEKLVWAARAKAVLRLAGRLKVVILACPPDRRARDLDNLPKAVLDALVHSNVIVDDADIDDLHIVRGTVERGGSMRVEIRELTA